MSGLYSCVFDGAAFVPTTAFHLRRAAEEFGAGEVVMLQAEHERSMRSHRHYFAMLHDFWMSLPERHASAPWAQSAEHLRKYLLILAGYSDSQSFPCTTAAEAQRWATRLRPLDEFSVIVVEGSTVVRFTAKSQSVKAMGAKVFQESKTAVLERGEQLLAVAA
jgi:hypothetical protein